MTVIPSRDPRWGFTLVELKVVIFVIGASLSLLLAGCISKVLDTAQATQCKNRLRDIGISVRAFEGKSGAVPTNDGTESIFYNLLGYVDREDVRQLYPSSSKVPAGFVVKNYMCPSDASNPGPSGAPASYVLNAAVFRGSASNPVSFAVAMENPSETLIAGERLAACGNPSTYTVWTDASAPVPGTSAPADMFGVNNVTATFSPAGPGPTAGMPIQADVNQSTCSPPPTNQWSAATVTGTSYFQSEHPRGTNFVRGDGGVTTLPGDYDPLLINLFCVPVSRATWSGFGGYQSHLP